MDLNYRRSMEWCKCYWSHLLSNATKAAFTFQYCNWCMGRISVDWGRVNNMSETIINSKQSLEVYIRHLRTQFDSHKYVRATLKTGKQRTLTQNKALHLYCEQLAQTLNEAGYDFRKTIKHDVDVPWSAELVKDFMWRPIQKAITGLDSTTKPERKQYGEIYEVLNRHTSSKLGVFVPWPCKDNIEN